jgi:hypothetical protein
VDIVRVTPGPGVADRDGVRVFLGSVVADGRGGRVRLGLAALGGRVRLGLAVLVGDGIGVSVGVAVGADSSVQAARVSIRLTKSNALLILMSCRWPMPVRYP